MSWIVVGLGNPGDEYTLTRHNTGRIAAEHFSKLAGVDTWKENRKIKAHEATVGVKKETVKLVLPDTFMNKSGLTVAQIVKSPKAAQKLIVIYDDLDLPLGKMKLSFDRGSGGHKGVESIIRAVKTRAFARIRIGVSPETPSGKLRKPSGEKEVNDFILGKFKPNEIKQLEKICSRSSEAIQTIIERGPIIAMNEFNSR